MYFEAISRAIKDISETISRKYDVLMFEKNDLRVGNGQVVGRPSAFLDPGLYCSVALCSTVAL